MTPRKYESELRQARADATRDTILDALVQVLADGVDTLSIPAVADRAGVSVGTVYRHFGDKAGLLKALVPYAGRRTGVDVDSVPTSMSDVDNVVRKVFRHFEVTDDLTRAAFASRIGREVRVQGSAERLELFRQTFRNVAPGLQSEELEHVARLGLILTTSEAYQQWKDRLGLTPEESSDEVMWAFRTVLRGLEP